MQYLTIIEKADTNFAAYVPDLPGCVSTGDTIEATIVNIREAITFHLSSMVRDNDPIPPQYTVLAVSVEIPNLDALRAASSRDELQMTGSGERD